MIDAPAPPCLASHLHYRSEGCTDATNNLTNKATIRFHCFKRSSFRGWRRVRMYVRISSYISDLPETFRRKNDCATKVRLYYMRICTGDICGQDGGGHGGTAGLPIQWARIQAGFRPPCSRATSLQSINSTATRARCSRVSSVPIPSFALTAGTYQI